MEASALLTIKTERLRLVACSPQAARAVVQSQRQAEMLLNARVHGDWPGSDIRAYLPLYAQQVEADLSRLGWGLWLIIQAAENMVIGDAGFKGKPDASGTVDVGYGIVPAYRRRGYAPEATRALCAWAFAQPGVRRITADCLPENTASARVLEKVGMKRIGESATGMLLWELNRDFNG